MGPEANSTDLPRPMSDVLKTWGTPMPIPIQKGRLGRGLASLIGETPEADARLPAHGEQRLLSLDQLHPIQVNAGTVPSRVIDWLSAATVRGARVIVRFAPT